MRIPNIHFTPLALGTILCIMMFACKEAPPSVSLEDKIDTRFVASQDSQRLDTLIDALVSAETITIEESWQMKSFFHQHPELVSAEWSYATLRKRASVSAGLAYGSAFPVEVKQFVLDTSSAAAWRKQDFSFEFRFQNLLPDTLWEADLWLILNDNSGKELFGSTLNHISGPIPPLGWSELVTGQQGESSIMEKGEKAGQYFRRSASDVRYLAQLATTPEKLHWSLKVYHAQVGYSKTIETYGYDPREVEHGEVDVRK